MNASNIIISLEQELFTPENLKTALEFTGQDQEALFHLARRKRDHSFPHRQVEVRSVIETSNYCRQACRFCSINRFSKRTRYTIDPAELFRIISHIYSLNRRVILLQSGENGSQKFIDDMCGVISRTKQTFPDTTLILCFGNLDDQQYQQLKNAGADRYILKFETSSALLYHEIKPDDTLERRLACLHRLIELGFQTGSGNIVGLPGQSLDNIVADLLLLADLQLTMASASIFIPGEESAFHDQKKGALNLALNTMALMRILQPQVLIPTTSSLEKNEPDGQFRGLMAGANTITIHDGTPDRLKKHFPIYSTKRFTPRENFLKEIVARAGLTM